MKRLCGLLMVLAMGPLAAEPLKQSRELTAEENKEVARLHAEANRLLVASRFEDAALTVKRIADYRVQRQGTRHWQVIDARLNVERWQRLTGVAAKDRAEVVQAERATVEGSQLQQRLRYREAEAKLREASILYRKVLGEQHPHAASSYSSVGFCLHSQGRYAEALSLYKKALAIRRKVLGEQHPDTANSYSGVAACLNSQGKHAEALPLFQKALAITLKVLGEEHPSTASRLR